MRLNIIDLIEEINKAGYFKVESNQIKFITEGKEVTVEELERQILQLWKELETSTDNLVTFNSFAKSFLQKFHITRRVG